MSARSRQWGLAVLLALLVAVAGAGLAHNARLFVLTLLNGLTLAGLYFLVASVQTASGRS